MTRKEILLKQYEIFSHRKLHFGKLFWQMPTIFIATCAFFANVVKDLNAPHLWWFVLMISSLLFLITYIGYRLQINENEYEKLMYDIEKELYSDLEGNIYQAHLSKKLGSRLITVIVLFIFAMSTFTISIFNLLF